VALLKIMPTLVSLLDKSWARQLRECLKVVEAVEKVAPYDPYLFFFSDSTGLSCFWFD
jgi:hypothetical protein